MKIQSLVIKGIVKMARKIKVFIPTNANAVTPVNKDSGYVFSTSPTTKIGQVTVTKKSGSSGFETWTNPGYDTQTSAMTFDGTSQSIAYNEKAEIHVAPLPFSLQVDINTTKNVGNQYVVNLGQGFGAGWPEFVLGVSNNNIYMSQATADDGSTVTNTSIGQIAMGTWYRVGVMFYRVGSTNFVRVYVNNKVVVQKTLGSSASNTAGQGGIPRTSSAGIAIGSDNVNYPGHFFKGQIRNLFIDHKLFWPI